MIALMTIHDTPIALEADFIESVTPNEVGDRETCVVRMASGKEHGIKRSYTYVTGVIRSHYEAQHPTAR